MPSIHDDISAVCAESSRSAVWFADKSARFTPSVELICDETGYELPPHTDGAMKLLTCLIYAGGEAEEADMGAPSGAVQPVRGPMRTT